MSLNVTNQDTKGWCFLRREGWIFKTWVRRFLVLKHREQTLYVLKPLEGAAASAAGVQLVEESVHYLDPGSRVIELQKYILLTRITASSLNITAGQSVGCGFVLVGWLTSQPLQKKALGTPEFFVTDSIAEKSRWMLAIAKANAPPKTVPFPTDLTLSESTMAEQTTACTTTRSSSISAMTSSDPVKISRGSLAHQQSLQSMSIDKHTGMRVTDAQSCLERSAALPIDQNSEFPDAHRKVAEAFLPWFASVDAPFANTVHNAILSKKVNIDLDNSESFNTPVPPLEELIATQPIIATVNTTTTTTTIPIPIPVQETIVETRTVPATTTFESLEAQPVEELGYFSDDIDDLQPDFILI